MAEETLAGSVPTVRDRTAPGPTGAAPGPALDELMREGPVTRIRLPGGAGWAWLVTRYEDVRAVADDPRFGREAVMDQQGTRPAPHAVPSRDTVAFRDPPGHTRLRRAVAAAFTAKGVLRVRDKARALLDELVDDLLRAGPPADLTATVLGPFPTAVICELMGVPGADRQDMHTWTRQIHSCAQGEQDGERAEDEMYGYFADLIGVRLDSACEDVASLLGGAVGRGEVSLEEAVGLAVLLQIGGEAVTHHSGRMFHLLMTRPDLLERLRAEPEIRPRAVEELLRCIPHRNAVGLPRIALEDVEISGVRIRAGDRVHVSYQAANRDPDVFPDPGTVDFDRDPDDHVAFGFGPHHCPGGMLARLESELLLDTLLDRVPGMRLAVPPDEVPFRSGAVVRGPETLPVTW